VSLLAVPCTGSAGRILAGLAKRRLVQLLCKNLAATGVSLSIPRKATMKRAKKMLIYTALAVLGILTVLFFGLGLHRKPHYIRHFEEEEYGRDNPFVEPASVVDGLAVYTAGRGEPVLLFPYPHGHTTEPMAQGPMARILTEMDRTVVTFDVPGAYRSTREPVGDVDEMIRSADETLDRLGLQGPVDVVGHSMGGLAALAYAIERPERTRRLVLVTSLSGFPAAARWGFPGSAFQIYEPDYWRIVLWGVRLNAGRGDLALHKRLQNLMERASYHDKAFFAPVEVDADDAEKGVPIRTIWSKNMYSRLSYADRLADVRAPILILAGRYDPEAPLACSEELLRGIPDADLVVFEQSGHFPFVEEASLFAETVAAFLNEEGR
jgi:pimeloyl-ACP methyl ester carboxylesterase